MKLYRIAFARYTKRLGDELMRCQAIRAADGTIYVPAARAPKLPGCQIVLVSGKDKSWLDWHAQITAR